MGPIDPPQARLPEPIPTSYYARRDGSGPEEARSAAAITALHEAIDGVRSRLLRRQAAGVLAGSTLVGGLIAIAALLVLLSHVVSSAHGGLASGQRPVATPAGTSAPRESPIVPVVQAPVGVPSPTPQVSPSPQVSPMPTSTSSPPPALVTFLNAPLAAHRGRSVSLQVRTTPVTTCTIVLGYPSAPRLDPATSDAGGAVSWTWRVAGPAPAGTWPVTVACGGTSATTQLVVS